MTTYAGLRTALADLGPPTADIRDRSHLDVAWMAFDAAPDLLRDLDAAQAAIRALADRVDQTQKPAPWEGFQWRPGDKERLREWNLAVASIQRWIKEGPHASAIAAAREGAPI